MINNVLYYPYMEFQNAPLIKSLAMFYDKIYRIVPDGIIPEDAEELQPLLEDNAIGGMIDPSRYSKSASKDFLVKIDRWRAAALSFSEEDEVQISRLHSEKTDQIVRELFEELGYEINAGFYDVPTELSSNYMLYLASEIGSKNNLSIVTDGWEPWTATTYFHLDGGADALAPYGDGIEDPCALFCFLVGEMYPVNISEIPSSKIAEFRNKRGDEIKNFRELTSIFVDKLQEIDDPQIRVDELELMVNQLKKAQADYKKSAELLKVKGWAGFSLQGFPASLALGNIFGVPETSTAILTGTAMAIGGLFHVSNTKEELRKLRASNPVSLMVDIGNEFKEYTQRRGGGDANFHAFNCMEEYVND
jgi:hypothetical protein